MGAEVFVFSVEVGNGVVYVFAFFFLEVVVEFFIFRVV